MVGKQPTIFLIFALTILNKAPKMSNANYREIIRKAVKDHPTPIYKRLKHLYGNELPNFANGYEKNDSSKETMINLLIRKAEAAPDAMAFLQNQL